MITFLAISIILGFGFEDYNITIGDSLLISVYGSVSFSYPQIVNPNGDIYIQYVSIPPTEEAPFIAWEVLDVLNIEGMSVRDASSLVEEKFEKYFKDIKVNLSITTFRDKIFVTGAILKPGPYPFIPGFTVADYMEKVGGALPSGDLSRMTITKYDSVIDVSPDSKVGKNWNIHIPQAYVYVSGMVTLPGPQPFDPNLIGLDYIGISGGPTDRANMEGAHIKTIEGKRLSVDENPPMYSTVMVPEMGIKWWQDYLEIASIITTVVVTWITLRK